MKLRNTFSSALLLCAMAAALPLLTSGMGDRADARQSEIKVFNEAGYGKTTGLFGIVEGQTARLAVWNKGDEPVLARLQFVDAQGKVLILCNSFIPAGKAAVEEWPCCGGAQIPDGTSRVELQAQFGTNEKRLIGLLVPTVQVIDGTSNATNWMIGPEGFAEYRPIWVPSLVPPY